jgi:hypothetical protein
MKTPLLNHGKTKFLTGKATVLDKKFDNLKVGKSKQLKMEKSKELESLKKLSC